MKISFNWLKDFIELKETPEDVSRLLTGTGLETEHVIPYEKVKGGLNGVVIGTVLTCQRHPNADKLSVTTVSVGKTDPLHIVCGAPNVAAGQRVVVATPGTTLHPSTGEPITLKSTRIRGELSEGMICAEDELGLGTDHAGILVLTTDLPDGSAAAEHFGLYSDTVFEIGITPNRADATSHMGVARDLRAVLRRPLRMPEAKELPTAPTQRIIPVEVRETAGCIRYSGITLSGIKVGESPAWLKDRLLAIGVNPINNIVDITNYVLHELGQPLHAFDADKIRGSRVIVQTLTAGTPFRTLDGKERQLRDHDLMICDEQGAMCLAGIFGGQDSGISDKTVTVFLESACFAPAFVRKSSQHHQLNTDASFRFARGTDPDMTLVALHRAAALMCEWAGGAVASPVADIYPKPVSPRTFTVWDERINRLIGASLTRDTTWTILRDLDIQVREIDADAFEVTVPPYRVDVHQEADIAEEILRIYGFNSIPLSSRVGSRYLADFPPKDKGKFRRTIGDMLTGSGFQEILTNSLIHERYHQQFGVALQDGEPVHILNKLSEEQGALRQTLLFSGLEVTAYNINRKEENLRLFEFGKVYWRTGEGGQQTDFGEREVLALFMTGTIHPDSWQDSPRAVGFHDLTRIGDMLLQRTNQAKVQRSDVNHAALEYGLSYTRGRQILGHIGLLKPSISKAFGIRQDVFYAEWHSDFLFEGINPAFSMKEIARFPKVRRDLSLVLDKHVTFAQIRDTARQTEKQLLQEVTVFDVYEGKNIPADKKAYAIGFTLLNESRTLTDQEIEDVMQRLMNSFEQKLGAVIRK